jgi:hypothetical protein
MWALESMQAGERRLWWRMSGPDRRHAVEVARESVRLLAARDGGSLQGRPGADPDSAPTYPPREVVAAALLHDVGKVEAGIGTFSRVAVTLGALAVGRDRVLSAADRPGAPGPVRRAGVYLRHDRLGAELLSRAGSHDLTVSWAAQHHQPPGSWTLERPIADALKAADGD